MTDRPLRFAAIGLDHRHIYHLVGELIAAGAECAGYCPQTSDPRVLEGFRERFPTLDPVERERLFDDRSIDITSARQYRATGLPSPSGRCARART